MQMCPQHWEVLRQGIKDRGLWHLVTTPEAADAMKFVHDGGASMPARYDPLFCAHWMIVGELLTAGFLKIMQDECCPLCEADDITEEPEEVREGVNICLDDILAYCQEAGLMHMHMH